MNRIVLSAALASLLAAGCGRAVLDARAPKAADAKISRHTAAQTDEGAAGAEADAPSKAGPAPNAPSVDAGGEVEPAAPPARAPGDYVAHRFTGSLQSKPLTLTQRIVAREGGALVVDITLSGDGAPLSLRVRVSDDPATSGEILGVARLTAGGRELPATLQDYERLMAKTALAADTNEAELGAEAVTVHVGGRPLACRQTSYRVRIDGRAATMRTLQSDQFAWGDVGGEITGDDGRVLYRAELIELGHGEERAAVATSEVASDFYYED
jgi:hypothetical protein